MQALKGIETALAKMRADTANTSISLIIKDTGSDSEKAAAGMEELVQEQVAAVIGPIVAAQSAATIAQQNGVPIITITLKDKITEIGDYVFRNFLTHSMQVEALVTFAAEEMGIQNFAILYPQEKYGSTFMNLFWDQVILHGGNVVGVEAYDPSHTDFAAPIKKLVGLYYDIPKDLRPEPEIPPEPPQPSEIKRRGSDEEELDPIIDFDAVFIPDAPNKAGLIIPQLAFYDIEGITLLGTNLWHSPKLIEMAKDYIQEAIIPDGFFADSTNRLVQAFVHRYESMYGQKPGFVAATTYDTAMILFELVSDSTIRSRNALKTRLANLTQFQGVTGVTSFDETGEVHKQVSLLRVQGGKFIEIEKGPAWD
jgi:ABC-type branched-subunit amino acid transport system substrate-binding protein